MITTYFRSSSYGQHDMCEQSYYLSYVLGVPSLGGIAAEKGTIVHKALETMARVGIATRAGQTHYEDEHFGTVCVEDASPDWATLRAWKHYTPLASHLRWRERDLEDCLEWTNKALTLWGGRYDPRKLPIYEPEMRFDITLPHDWARFEFDTAKGKLEGQLSIKGTVDNVIREDDGTIHIIDWKTGARKNWATGEEKTYKKLRYDPQLCLYHYAAKHMFPDAPEIFITIVYINTGGPYTVCFEPEDIYVTEELLRRKFKRVRDTKYPKLRKSWRCTSFCYFGKTMSEQDPSKTICDYFAGQVRAKGADKVFDEFGNFDKITKYGDGGGRKSDDAK